MERENNDRSELKKYGFADRTHRRSMRRYTDSSKNRSETKTKVTLQLPAGIEASLYSGLTEPFHFVRKFKKTEPEAYLTVGALLKDEDFSTFRGILVRECGFGFIPVLLALGQPRSQFLVSSWLMDRRGIIERNAMINLVEERVDFVTEGLFPGEDQEYDSAILIHEQHINPDIVVYEAARLLSKDTCNFLYLVTHKKKGGISVSARISDEVGTHPSWIKKGLGGAIIVKYTKKEDVSAPEIPVLVFDYLPQPSTRVKFETTPSLFSAEGVDVGSDLLIKTILSEVDPKEKIPICDIACGYGAIGLSLAASLPNAMVVMSDADARAVDMAKRNIEYNGLGQRVSVQLADGARDIQGKFGLVVSNPPLHTERPKLREILIGANKLVRKDGKMLMVIENSRVEELREVLGQRIGFIRERVKFSTHSVLEIKK